MKPIRRASVVAVALTALVLTAAGVAAASIPDPGGVIHGCRKNSDGSVRVIDSNAGQTCASGWTALNWSQTGPQGVTGATGVLGLVVVADSYQVTSTSETVATAQASCPSGKVAIAGGASSATPSGKPLTDYVLHAVGPEGSGAIGTTWHATYVFPSDSVGFLATAFAVCAYPGG
jgi:hypothetical protein